MPNFARKDDKAMRLGDLIAVVEKLRCGEAVRPGTATRMLNKPIVISCDEEGNEMLALHSVEVDSKTGQLTFWPMHR